MADVLPTAEISPDSIDRPVADVFFDAVIICSVVPAKAAVLKSYFDGKWPLHFLDYSKSARHGYRLPAALADRCRPPCERCRSSFRHGAPAIIIDFGTAVTFDVISAEPAYCGGVIAPGLGAMSGYLSKKTALLPVIELAEPRPPSANPPSTPCRWGPSSAIADW